MLQLYDLSSNPCLLYNKINLSKPTVNSTYDNNHKEFPWLYYSLPSKEILESVTKVNFEMSIDKRDPLNFYILNFKLFVYTIDGKLKRIEPLTDQIVLCSSTWDDGHKYREFQTSFSKECEIDMKKYLNSNTLEFYEIFLVDSGDPKKLIDIPILITNIKNPKFEGLKNNETGIENYILTRRFFLVDNLSGIEGEKKYKYYSGFDNPTSVIRFPKSIKLKVTLRNVSGNYIFPPMLEIEYASKLVSSMSVNSLSKLSFKADYNMEIKKFRNAMLGILIFLLICCILFSGLKLNVWRNTHPNIYNPVRFLYLRNSIILNL